MHVSKEQGIYSDHLPFFRKEDLVTVKKESSIEKLLRVDRDHRIEDHDEDPKQRIFFDKRKKMIGDKEIDQNCHYQGYDEKLF